MLQDFRRFDLRMKNGPRCDNARAEGRRLFELAQLDIWDSLRSALQLPKESSDSSPSRVAVKEKIGKEDKRFGKLIKANLEFLLEEDGGQASYDAVTASLAALEVAVKAAFPSKPPQIVADVVTLYKDACGIEALFNEVLILMMHVALYLLIYTR